LLLGHLVGTAERRVESTDVVYDEAALLSVAS